jgi:hypothetical protein
MLRNRKPNASETGSSETEMEREKVLQISQLDDGDGPSDGDNHIAANQIPPASSELSSNKTRPQQPPQVLPQDSEQDQMLDTLHTILANILESVQASKEEITALIQASKERTIKIIHDRVTGIQEGMTKLSESTRNQVTSQPAELKDTIIKLPQHVDRKLDTSICETHKKIKIL